MGFVGLNLRTFSGVPAWSNVQARIVEGITDMMIYGMWDFWFSYFSGRRRRMMLLTQLTQNVPQPNTEFLQFPARPQNFWSHLTRSEDSQGWFYCSLLYQKNNEFVIIGTEENILRLWCRSYLIGCHQIILLAWFGLGVPSLE